jgi:hypothetical protein
MKTYWGVEVYLHAFLTWALGGGEWSASRLGKTEEGTAECRELYDEVLKTPFRRPRRRGTGKIVPVLN